MTGIPYVLEGKTKLERAHNMAASVGVFYDAIGNAGGDAGGDADADAIGDDDAEETADAAAADAEEGAPCV